MESKDDLQTALRSLRNVRRMARRLQRVSVDCLRVNSGDIADAEYVTEWLGIVLCRVCGQQDVSMPPFEAGAAPVTQFRWFIQKAARQAGAIQRAIFWGRVSKALFAEKAWEGLDSAETFLGSFLSENVYRERRRMMRFPRKEIVEAVRARYPKGTRVELVFMDDPYSRLKPGDRGTVEFVDDIATVHVKWDCGSGLGVAYGADKIRILEGGDFE